MKLRALNHNSWKLWDTDEYGDEPASAIPICVTAALNVKEWTAAVGSRSVTWTVRVRESDGAIGVSDRGWTGLMGTFIPAAAAMVTASNPVFVGADTDVEDDNEDAAHTMRDGEPRPACVPKETIPAPMMYHEFGVSLPIADEFGMRSVDVQTMRVVRSDFARIWAKEPDPVRPDWVSHSEWEAKLAAKRKLMSCIDVSDRERLVVTCDLESSTMSVCFPDHSYAGAIQWSYAYRARVMALLHPSFIAIGTTPVEITFE